MKQFDSFGLDIANECLWRDGAQILLPPKPFAVLRHLVENPGRLVTHDELLDKLWPETYVQPQVLRTYILDLRKILGDDAGQPRFIRTLPKRGYCFIAAVADRTVTDCNPRPSTVHSANVIDIVGREEERARLEAQAQLVETGQRQVVFITGGAGIGKTALIDAFCKQLESSLSADIARGQCVEGVGTKEDYYPVMEALSHLCVPTAERGYATQTLSTMAPAWLPPHVRKLKISDTDGDPSSLRRVPGDLCAALEGLAQDKPLILIFEDIHWADVSTLELISALARRRASAKMMVLASFRPQDGTFENHLKALKQDLGLRRLATEIALPPLSKNAVSQLLRHNLEQEALPPGLEDFVYQRSEGNPLFAIAVLRHLISQSFLVREKERRDSKWEQRAPVSEMAVGVPEELKQLIEVQIERLSAAEQHILEASSLMSFAFPTWAVAAALAKDPIEIEEACDEMAHRFCFVRRVGHDDLPDGTRSTFYVFAHDLYREVLYQRQAPARRAKGHTRIADRLAELFAGREASVAREMATHYEAAGNWRRAASALRSSAHYALERKALPEARQLLEHALLITEELGGDDRDALKVQIRRELEMSSKSAAGTRRGKKTSRKLDDYWIGV